jgi:large subunit ribosomal protein L13
MIKMNIDGKNLILGRLGAYAAKQALLGEDVNVYNCDLVVISGKRKNILKKYEARVQRGDPHHGPYFPRVASNLVRRTIRGMLPYKQTRGKEAYKKVKCFPGADKVENLETVEKANIEKIHNTNFITVRELCRNLKK